MKSLVLILALASSLSSQTSLSQLTSNNTSAVRGLSTQPANVSKLPIRSLLYPGATTKVLVRYMGWYGSPKHKDVGYRSDNATQARRQVDDMVSRGIDGAIVAWYGPQNQPGNRSTQLLFAEAERHPGFKVAVSIDSGAFDQCKQGCDETSEFIRLLHYVEQNYESSSAYLRVNGRPLVTSFGLEKRHIDWDRVRAEARDNPLFIFRNSGGFNHAQSDGAFSWVAPETVNSNDPLATEYLKRFNRVGSESRGKLIVASAYKGFDDSQASWSKHFKIAENCGQTWLATFDVINSIYSSRNQLPFLLIPTWNDYEEGTEIETGIDNCVSIEASVRSNRLQWKVNGLDKTIDHFEIFASKDGTSLTQIGTAEARDHDYNLKQLPSGTRVLFVRAVGRPSIRNQISGPVQVNRN
jgi:hypothetical protein